MFCRRNFCSGKNIFKKGARGVFIIMMLFAKDVICYLPELETNPETKYSYPFINLPNEVSFHSVLNLLSKIQ